MKAINKMNHLLNTQSKFIVILAVVFYILVFSLISIWKYCNFGYDGLDLAIINQVFYNSIQGNFFASSIHPPSYLGDHFTPIIFLLLPFYILFQHPVTLLILQTIALAICAWPIYLIAKNVLTKKLAVLLAIAWLINPFVQNINLFEFHFLPFALFFIFWAFYFYQNQKFLPFVIFSSLALLVREDVALVIFVFGIFAIWEKKKMKWRATSIILSILYFITAIKLSGLLSGAEQYKFLLYYSWLGDSWIDIIKNIILHPWLLMPKIFNPGSAIVAAALLLSTGFLPVLKPKYLLLSSIIYFQLLIGVSWQWLAMILFTQYSALLLPGIFIATIFAIKEFNNKKSTNPVVKFIFKEKTLTTLIILTAIIYSSILMGPLTGSLNKIAQNKLTLSDTLTKKEILAQIPDNASVAATYEMLTPLSTRQNIASLNYVFLGKQQFATKNYTLPENTKYLAIDFTDLLTYQLQYKNNSFFKKQYQFAINNWPTIFTDFGLITIKDSLALFERGAENKFKLVEFLTSISDIKNSDNTPLSSELTFLGFNKSNDHYQLFWRFNNVAEKNYQFKLILRDNTKTVFEKIHPLGYGLITNESILDKKIIQTNYWFEFDKNLQSNTYDLAIQIISIENGRIELDADRSTQNTIDKDILIGPEIDLGQITI